MSSTITQNSLPFYLDVAVGGRPNGFHLARFTSTTEYETTTDDSVKNQNNNDNNDNNNNNNSNNKDMTTYSSAQDDDYHSGYMFENAKEKSINTSNGKQETITDKQPQGSWRMEILEDGTITYSVDSPLLTPTPSPLLIEPKVESFSERNTSSLLLDSSQIEKTMEASKSFSNNRTSLKTLHSTNAIEKSVCSHYEQSGSFGQDAYAVYVVPNSAVHCLAVADGVGGWRDNNIDSGILSRALMRECVKSAPQFSKTADAPLSLMKSIFNKVKTSGEVDAGSTTACIVTLSGVAPPIDPILGDSTAQQMLIDDFLSSQSSSNTPSLSSSGKSSAPNSPSTSSSPSSPSNSNHNIRIISAEHSNSSANTDINITTPPTQSEQKTSSSLTSSQKTSSASPASSSLYLHCANLGDSGYFLIRNSRVVNRSAFQRDGRIVKQLAVIPPRYMGHSYCDDPPEDSSLTHFEVQDGDLLIIASDGLWDNLIPPAPLFFHYIFGLMSHDGSLVNWNEQLKEKIESIVAECQWEIEREQLKQNGSSPMLDENPFVSAKPSSNNNALKHNSALVRKLCDRLVHEASSFMNTMHGKPDDLTVLVAQICRS